VATNNEKSEIYDSSNVQREDNSCRCWVCGSREMQLTKRSNYDKKLTPSSFAITDSYYGITGDLHRCNNCGFVQCCSISDVTAYYEELEDKAYEEGRTEREIQAKQLLQKLKKYRQNGRLLDIGAGSGILLEEAEKTGYQSEGVEPSRWLYGKATERGLNVHLGTFPHKNIQHRVDLITLVDVIEHVSDPLVLLNQIRESLDDNGIGLIATPDLDSLAAKVMGWRWWHFRIAHIGYFNKRTLEEALNRSGFEVVKWGRPVWYFSIRYLLQRVNKYLPSHIRIPAHSFLSKIIIPINLRDSLYVIFKKKAY
jgi:2-polyprenyl-3-methyl-5-hydroxy-6-metoxy-1,4-benzoquinol methylase